MTRNTKPIKTLEDTVTTALQKAKLSPKEMERLLATIKQPMPSVRTYDHHVASTHAKIMFISDSHIGHKEFKPELLNKAFAYAKAYKPVAIYHSGDIIEGMSGRPGHIYELSHIGATAQINYASELLSKSPVKIYGITGNHDQWLHNKGDAGLDVGQSLEDKIGKSKFEYLGMNEADIMLNGKTKLKLFHPNDGTAYATSYKLQKLMESFSGGEKPQILVEGHYHKALYMFNRNIHGFEAGTLCGQTGWMRGKKIPAQTGFWMVDVRMKKTGEVEGITPEFIASYD
jgi:predicted phosphodiesterase